MEERKEKKTVGTDLFIAGVVGFRKGGPEKRVKKQGGR